MRIPIFDCHVHMDVRNANDYELMALSGVERILIPCDFTGEKRPDGDAYGRFYERLLKLERERSNAYGVKLSIALALDPQDMFTSKAVTEAIDLLPHYLRDPAVVAVGELVFKEFTQIEIDAFTRQLRLAHEYSLPAMIKAPRGDRNAGLRKTLEIVEDAIRTHQLDRRRIACMDLYLDNIDIALAHDLGGYGIPVSPVLDSLFVIHQKVNPREAAELLRHYGSDRLLFNSGLHFGYGDPLALARVMLHLRQSGVAAEELAGVFYQNAKALFG